MPVMRWKTLSCPQCAGQQLVQLYTLRFHPAGGTSPEPSGFRCAACQTDVDQRAMLAALRRHELQQELHQLETEQETLLQTLSGESSDASSDLPTRATRGSSNSRNT
jgi:hypothetical protein